MMRHLFTIRKSRPNAIIIRIDKTNFFMISRLIMLNTRKSLLETKKIIDFNLMPLTNISTRFNEYLSNLSLIMHQEIKLEIDPNLFPLLLKFEQLALANPNEFYWKRLLRFLGIITGHAFIGPELIHIDINNSCNLTCHYCWWFSKERKMPLSEEWIKTRISLDSFKKLASEMAEIKTDGIIFSGTGEPLLHPDILEMIRFAKDKGFYIEINTNGTLLTKELNQALVDNKADELLVSISSSDRANYNHVHDLKRDNKMFDSIIKGIENLKTLRGDSEFPRIVLIFVLDSTNYDHIFSMTSLAVDINADRVRFQLANNDWARNIETTGKMKQAMRKDFLKSKGYADTHGLLIESNFGFQLDNTDETNQWYEHTLKSKGCYIGWFFTRQWADGRKSFCCERKFMDDDNGKKSLRCMWDSEEYKWLRFCAKSSGKPNEKLVDESYIIDKKCHDCGNYEHNEEIYAFLRNNDLLKFI